VVCTAIVPIARGTGINVDSTSIKLLAKSFGRFGIDRRDQRGFDPWKIGMRS
jgi:hypothetical protein